MKVGIVFFILVSVHHVTAHSWIHCSDWRGKPIEKNSDWNVKNCKGFARGFGKINKGMPFGRPHGLYNNNVHTSKKICVWPKTEYSAQYPPPSYKKGEEITILWPSKNHGGRWQQGCGQNAYDIEDKLYAFCDGTKSEDISMEKMTTGKYNQQYLVTDWKEKAPKKFAYGEQTALNGNGFRNCPDVCENITNAVCYGKFKISDGFRMNDQCIFVWYWQFYPNQWYTTCWDVTIGGGPQQPTLKPTLPPSFSANPGCGKKWEQCGGAQGYNGPKCCEKGTQCKFMNEWYSQCL
jgi:hypothetical protein